MIFAYIFYIHALRTFYFPFLQPRETLRHAMKVISCVVKACVSLTP